MEQFDSYKQIDTIRDLGTKVNHIKEELTKLVITEFDRAFGDSPGSKNLSVLRQACEVADVLEPQVKKLMLKRFLQSQFGEYLVLYDSSQEDAWLTNVTKRFR